MTKSCGSNSGKATRKLSRSAALLLGSSMVALVASPVFAATDTWTGLSNSNWSDLTNWSTFLVPVTGDDVVLNQPGFNAPSSFDINVNLHSLTLNTAADLSTLNTGYDVENAGGFVFGLQSGGSITDNAANFAIDRLNMGITLNGPATITVATGATGLSIGGIGISGTGGLTVSNHGGASALQFLADNTYTGGTTISLGTLQLGNGGTTGSIVGDVVDNGSLAFDHSNNVNFSGSISGTGSVKQIGTGTLTLSGTNLYSGGTFISGGILSASADANLGLTTGGISIDNGATLQLSSGFSNSRNVALTGGTATIDTLAAPNSIYIFNGVISGAGALNKTSSGVLVLTNTNTYSGGTTISGGVLSLGDISGGTTGSVAGNIVDNGSLIFNRTDSLTFSNVISGTGAVTKNFADTLTLTGDNTYTGNTLVSLGTLQLGNGGTSGIVAGNIALGGTFDSLGAITAYSTVAFDRSDDIVFASDISGVGALDKKGTNKLTLTGHNSYMAGTTIEGGTLQIGNGGATGTLTGDVANSGILAIDLSSAAPNLLLAGVISGSGSFEQLGTGTTIFTGNNTYTGGTTISAGTLQIGTGGGAGAIVGDIADNGTLVINLGDTLTLDIHNNPVTTPTVLTLSGTISGTGALVQMGPATTILTGTDTYSGGTTISHGTLQIGNGGTAGSITGDILDNASLVFDRSNAITVGGIISGTGSVSQIGAGTLTLSGVNTYSGGTNISAGEVVASTQSSIGTGDVNISNGALLTLGSGTFTSNANLGTGGGTFSNAADVVWSGVIAGSTGNTFVKTGAGRLTLTGTNTYTGGTTISAGTLQIGNGGAAGSILGDVTDNGELDFDRSDNITFAGLISGTGVLGQLGSGTLKLTGINTYTGGTKIDAGTLSISSDSNLGNGGTVAMAAGTTLKITASGTFTHSVTLTGDPIFNVASGTTTVWSGLLSDGLSAGTLEVDGSGILNLTNASNSYSGGTIVRGNSTLRIDADGELGASTGDLTLGDASTSGILNVTASFNLSSGRAVTLGAGGGTITTDPAFAFKIGQGITGAGALTVKGAGTLILSGTNSYGGGTTITGGNLQLGDGVSTGTITGDVLDNGTLAFDEVSDVTFAGLISGTGSLTQNDATLHTLILTADNTYTGGTTISSGTLQLGNGGTTGLIVGDIADNGALAIDRSDAITLAGLISGTGSLSQIGAGTTTLTGNNTYSGGTTISLGTLQIGGGGTSGAITGNVTDNGTLAIDRSDALTLSGTITGTGALVQMGPGTTTLTGNDTYSGGTTISIGTLQIGIGGVTGSIIGNVTDNGTFAIDRSDALTLAGIISGSGSLKQIGTGTTTLTANNTYTGGTTISAGTLQIGNGGTTGAITGNVADNGTLAFNRSDSTAFAGLISGTGALNKLGAGTLTLTGNNTYTGATTINAGTLQIGNGGTAGSIAGNVADSGILAFDRSDELIYAGAISGTGSVKQIGSGTTFLTGANTYSGGTTISLGILEIGNGGATGSITGNVTDNGVLAFNRSTAFTFGGIISGTGGVSQLGAGTTTLTGINTYTGATTVNAGTLLVDGSIAGSSATVNSGATLGGTGSVGNLTIGAGGIVAPGDNGVGTLDVLGNLSLAPNSIYAFDATPSASDLLDVSGTATVHGSLLVDPLGSNFNFNSNITLIDAAGGLTGEFSSVSLVSGFGGNLIPIVGYDANHAFLTFVPASIAPLLPVGTSSNEANVASAIDFAIAHDGAALAFAPFGTMASEDIDPVLSQMSGEVGAGLQNAADHTADTFLNNLLDPSVGGRDGMANGGDFFGLASNQPFKQLASNDRDAPLVRQARREVMAWGDFRADHSQTDGDMALGTHTLTSNNMSGEIGFDYSPATGNGDIGVAFGFGGTNWGLANDLGKGHANAYQAGLYYSRMFGPNYFSAGVAYALYRVETNRTLDFAGTNVYHAEFRAKSTSGRFEYGHMFDAGDGHRLTPFIRVQAIDLGTPNYAETTITGSSSYALSFTKQQHFDYTSELGSSWDKVLDAHGNSMTGIHARLGWVHDWSGSGLTDTATFSAFNGASFTLNAAPPPKNAAHVAFGVEHDINNISLTLNADSMLSNSSTSYGGTLSVAFKW